MGTCTTKQCIVQQLTVQLKTLNSSDLSAVGGAATSSGESKSFGTAHKQQPKQQGEEDLQGFGKDSSNLPLGKLDSLVHNRDQILLLEDVTIAFRMQDLEFQGVEGDILEAETLMSCQCLLHNCKVLASTSPTKQVPWHQEALMMTQ
jgi:hypothetical protein